MKSATRYGLMFSMKFKKLSFDFDEPWYRRFNPAKLDHFLKFLKRAKELYFCSKKSNEKFFGWSYDKSRIKMYQKTWLKIHSKRLLIVPRERDIFSN